MLTTDVNPGCTVAVFVMVNLIVVVDVGVLLSLSLEAEATTEVDGDGDAELSTDTGIELSPLTILPLSVVSTPVFVVVGCGFKLNVVYPPVGPEKVAEAVTKIITMLLGGVWVALVVFRDDEEVLISLSAGVVRVRSPPAAGVTTFSEVIDVLPVF